MDLCHSLSLLGFCSYHELFLSFYISLSQSLSLSLSLSLSFLPLSLSLLLARVYYSTTSEEPCRHAEADMWWEFVRFEMIVSHLCVPWSGCKPTPSIVLWQPCSVPVCVCVFGSDMYGSCGDHQRPCVYELTGLKVNTFFDVRASFSSL